MARITSGNIRTFYGNGVALQPGYSITEKNDGTLEGSVNWVCDEDDIMNLPQIGSTHPKDFRLECYNRDINYAENGRILQTSYYFGLVSAKTNPVISYTPNTDQDNITSHVDFPTFGGTKAEPLNGAKFDQTTGEFLGFFDPEETELFGVSSYLVPSTLVSATYWQNYIPRPERRMTRKSPPNFIRPPDVAEFLLLDSPYRQVGNFYQVTENYLGSGANGFSTIIYP